MIPDCPVKPDELLVSFYTSAQLNQSFNLQSKPCMIQVPFRSMVAKRGVLKDSFVLFIVGVLYQV